MTQSKREPFAKATKHPTLDTWLVADAAGNNLCWADDSQAWEQWDAESRANSINAAFNARVDEEVRKAVAERDARIAELERVLESLVRAGNYLKETAETHVMQTYDTRGSVGRKISEWDAALADIKTVLGKGE